MIKFFIPFFFVAVMCFGKNFYDDHARGWHWYETITHTEDSKKSNAGSKKKSATEELKEYQDQLEEVKAQAVLHPTSDNVLAYQKMQYEMMQKAGRFLEVWMQNVYKNVSIDHTKEFPVSQNARHIYIDEQHKEIEAKITQLSKEYGLFYFFKDDCAYCDQFSITVKIFSEKYNWEVLAISENGEKNETFKRNVKDNGLAETWGVTTYPSLFAVNPKTGHVIPIANGMISIQEMEERIISIAKEMDEKHD